MILLVAQNWYVNESIEERRFWARSNLSSSCRNV